MEVDGKRLEAANLSELCKPCESENLSKQADGFCKDCNVFMCLECFRHHLKGRLCRNNNFEPVKDLSEEGSYKTQETKCKTHATEIIKYFCRFHYAVGCGDCFVLNHRNCEVEFIRDLANNFEESSEFNTFLRQIHKWEKDKAEIEAIFERNKQQNKTFLLDAVRKIRKSHGEILISLDKMEEMLEGEVRKVSDSNEKQISHLEESIKNVSSEIETIQENVNSNVYKADDLFIRHVECKTLIGVVNTAFSEIKSNTLIKAYTFEPDKNAKENLTSSVKLGIIRVGEMKREKKQITETESFATNACQLPGPDFHPQAAGIGIGKRFETSWNYNPLVVASIDLGTTCSVCSYSSEANSTPYIIRWVSDTHSWLEKAPSHILIRGDGKTIEAFGYEAAILFNKYKEGGEEKSFYFFRSLENTLKTKAGENLDGIITIEDESGRSLPAMDVFAAAIMFLKKYFLQGWKKNIHKFDASLTEDAVQWVLIVPPVWSNEMQQVMKEAAVKAEIESEQLLLITKPEAAYVRCRHLSKELEHGPRGLDMSHFQPGTRHLLIQAGDVIEIMIYEVTDATSVQGIYSAKLEDSGSRCVYDAFETLMKRLTGEDVYSTFCEEDMEDRYDLINDFGIKLYAISNETKDPFRMVIPISLFQQYHRVRSSTLEKDILRSEFSDSIKFNRTKMILSAETARSLFKDSIDKLIYKLKNVQILHKPSLVFMVGKFLRSPMVQSAVKRNFPNASVLIPNDPDDAVNVGGLILGNAKWRLWERFTFYK